MSTHQLASTPSRSMLWAGMAGGLAEVVWIAIAAPLLQTPGFDVARGISTVVLGDGFEGTPAAFAGLAIHFALSLAVAYGFIKVLWRPLARAGGAQFVVAGAVISLALIWAMNFLVILPAIDPAFAALLPMPVTFVSKLLFGAGLGLVLARAERG